MKFYKLLLFFFSKIVLINLKKSEIISVKTKEIQGMINIEVGSQAKKCGLGTGCPTIYGWSPI